jgi:hypothetical protein
MSGHRNEKFGVLVEDSETLTKIPGWTKIFSGVNPTNNFQTNDPRVMKLYELLVT